MRVVVVGARRARQGIGAFVAEAFVGCGCEVAGVVGTTPETVHAAAAPLDANGYLDLEEAIDSERPDLVALCSPIEAHARQLRIVAEADCHCLCDKPLLWPPGPTTSRVLDTFEKNGKHLALLTQWPHTLTAFYALHPDVATATIESFIMRLSPMSKGPRMLLDSMSHPLSMLERLCGHARVRDVAVTFDGESCRTEFTYRGVACVVGLKHRAEPPRPASYAINGCAVSRVIGDDYEIYFEAPYGRRIPLRDPMPLRVREVVQAARAGVPTDRESITLGMDNLEALLVGLQV
ncbi:MAG: Gfo/Idh/MocA family protein [Planctomycetota bacterium]|jgi:predicted dehydrogenase